MELSLLFTENSNEVTLKTVIVVVMGEAVLSIGQ